MLVYQLSALIRHKYVLQFSHGIPLLRRSESLTHTELSLGVVSVPEDDFPLLKADDFFYIEK
jgi:hypothetical protein